MFAALKTRRISLKTAISLAAVIVAGGMTAAPAQAQLLGACPSIIEPPPCIIFDYKGLANWAQTHAQVLQQIDQVKSSIEQTQATVQGIGQVANNLATINFQMPDIDASPTSLLGGIPQTSDLTSIGSSYASKVFAPSGQNHTVDGAGVAQRQRYLAVADANVDAYANRAYVGNQTGKSQTDVINLNNEVANATSLQEDWVANSHVKIAVIAAMTQRSYMLSTYLKMSSAQGTLHTQADVSSGSVPGPITPSSIMQVTDTVTPLVKQLDALLAQASSLMASVQVVQIAQTNLAELQSEIDDYNNTVARNNALNAKFASDAQGWSEHHWQQIIDDTNAMMAAKDTEYANYRPNAAGVVADPSGSATQLSRRFDAGTLATFATDEVDPRQFLGTWSDPMKGTLGLEISNALTGGSLDDYLSGNENDEFRADVLGTMNGSSYSDGLYSLREEVAWKAQLVNGDPNDPNSPSVQSQMDQDNQEIAAENARQGFDVSGDSVTQKLTDIVNQSNQIGKQISDSGDVNAMQEASATLAELQQVVGNGTGLPAVDATSIISTDASGNDTVVSGPTDLTIYPTTTATTTTTGTTTSGTTSAFDRTTTGIQQ